MLFEAALRQAYIDLDKPDPADEKSSYSWDTLLSQLALNCFRSGIPEEAVVSRARFRHFVRKPLELVRQVVRNVYSRRQDFGSKCALSREQQLSVLIAEFMKRRYEFRFNVQTGEAEFRERHSFCFRFQPVDKRALNSIALDAQAEGIPCGTGISAAMCIPIVCRCIIRWRIFVQPSGVGRTRPHPSVGADRTL